MSCGRQDMDDRGSAQGRESLGMWEESSPQTLVSQPTTGSFDCVRLTPHFAQDDRSSGP